jgi:hypothetical protein
MIYGVNFQQDYMIRGINVHVELHASNGKHFAGSQHRV